MGFLFRRMCIRERAEIDTTIKWLEIVSLPRPDFSFIPPDLAVCNPGIKFMKPFGIVGRTDARVILKIPLMQATNEVSSFYSSVRRQGPAMETSPL